jgi:perosamine synthetase
MVHSYYQYIVRREDAFPISRDDIVRILTEDGIGSRPSYPKPLYKQKALQDLRIRGRCPITEDVVPRLFELPVHPGVGPGDLERILDAMDRLAQAS